MLPIILLGGLAIFASATPTPYKREDAAEFTVQFDPSGTLIPFGTNLDSVGSAFKEAANVCSSVACSPGAMVTVDVGVLTSGGTYPQMETAPLTIAFEGLFDPSGDDSATIRDGREYKLELVATRDQHVYNSLTVRSGGGPFAGCRRVCRQRESDSPARPGILRTILRQESRRL